MPETLKPCPFCGGEAKFGANKSCCGKTVRIDCTNPDCGACVTAFSSKVYAAKAWNRRTQQPNEPLTVDELRKMDGDPVWIDDWYQDFHGWELSVDATDYLENRDLSQYGSQWIAYRRPPEEGEKG